VTARFPKARAYVVKTALVREIKITTLANGEKHALWRWHQGRSIYWHSLPTPRAEAALRVGRMSYAGYDGPVIPSPETVEAA